MQPTAAFDDASTQRLAERIRCFVDLLLQEVWVAGSIDVAGRDRGGREVGLGHRQCSAVVGGAGDAVDLAGAAPLEDDDLSA